MNFQIIEMAKGNPGAASFLAQVYHPSNSKYTKVISAKLEECKTIRGTNLYVLFSDLCKKDMALVNDLCNNCPSAVLEDACSRQDYSGRDLVKEYLPKN